MSKVLEQRVAVGYAQLFPVAIFTKAFLTHLTMVIF